MLHRLYLSGLLFASNPVRLRQTMYVVLTLVALTALILGAGQAMADPGPGGPYPTP